jgi:hypothetical protein
MSSKTRVSFGFQISLGLILAGAILWFYCPILVSLTKAFLASEDNSFGLLLPLVSSYIVYLIVGKLDLRLTHPIYRRGVWRNLKLVRNQREPDFG